MEFRYIVRNEYNRYRYGVLIRWDNYGTGHHIHIKNCDIHEINAEMSRFTGEGILVVSTGTEDGVPTNFDDVLLEGNRIEDIDRTGISVIRWMGENCSGALSIGRSYPAAALKIVPGKSG